MIVRRKDSRTLILDWASGVRCALGAGTLLCRSPGEKAFRSFPGQDSMWTPEAGLRICRLRTCGRDIFCVEAENLRLLFAPSPCENPGSAGGRERGDILVLSLGQSREDTLEARELCAALSPRIILPLEEPGEGQNLADFLHLFPEKTEELQLLRVTQEDLACQMRVARICGVRGQNGHPAECFR